METNELFDSVLQFYQEENLIQAQRICKELIDIDPDNINALILAGMINLKIKHYEDAVQYIKKAIYIDPQNSNLYFTMGTILHDQSLFDEAIQWYKLAVCYNPDFADAHYNLGLVFQKKQNIDEAVLHYRMALQIEPYRADLLNNLGFSLKEKGFLEEAIACYEQALNIDPDLASTHNNMGIALHEKGAYHEAIHHCKKAIEIIPDIAEAHWELSLLYLLSGDFEKGWKEYKWRLKLNDNTDVLYNRPLWDGSQISNKIILLHPDQGLGDTIQFIRYADIIHQIGAEVIVECYPELVTLLKKAKGVSTAIIKGERLPHFDIHCSLSSLPFFVKTRVQNIPAKIPYIESDSNLIDYWEQKLFNNRRKFRIGLVWAGSPAHRNDIKRSCHLQEFLPLVQIENIQLYSLQKWKASEQINNLPVGMEIIDHTKYLNDFSDTAAFINNLDMVISVDTAIAHLAGALGKPVWTLLPYVPDWRWMLNREDSPWYPTMRLFRQPAPGDWSSVILRVKDELQKVISS